MPDAMPRKLNKRLNLWDKLEPAAKRLSRKFVPDDYQIDYDTIVNCYWSKADREHIKNVFGELVSNSSISPTTFEVTREVTISNEALPVPYNRVFSFVIEEPDVEHGVLWPKALFDRDIRDRLPITQIDHMAQSIVETAFNRGLLIDVVEWLRDNCTTHQAAATLFPAWAMVLRSAEWEGAKDIANRCDERARVLPALPPFMRQKLRYLNNLIAGHILMGTFENETRKKDVTLCTMTMQFNADDYQVVGEAKNWVSFKP